MERHEQNWQRAKGFLAAASVAAGSHRSGSRGLVSPLVTCLPSRDVRGMQSPRIIGP